MSSPTFELDLSSAYDRLHPIVQKWVRDQGWEELREIQARTILAVLDSEADILIAATTAAGKTEAGFLPVLSKVADRSEPGFAVLYISPLKALINDQFRRLDDLCERMEIPVVRWHGDAPQAAKRAAFAKPEGVALITPESIEAMLSRRPLDAKRLLGAADFIIIDELHAFLTGPRGLHLASLLRRIDAMAGKSARRIGLSATLGDFAAARSWLRPTEPQQVELLESSGDSPELHLQIRGYQEPSKLNDPDQAEGAGGEGRIALDDIADHLFKATQGSSNLVFGGSRRTVEAAADRLRRRCEDGKRPNEYFPHHGSLSKSLREDLEIRLKDGQLPTTAVCTSTLELGIDIGSVKAIAQIGPPRALSSLRQRLGRTGRRKGVPSILRIYVREPRITQESSILDELRSPTVRSTAAVRLLLQGFVEPPSLSPEVGSTLVHQILSVIVERGGVRAEVLYKLLCGPGPFAQMSTSDLAALLGHMGAPENALIEQSAAGLLMLGEGGEKITQSRDFFAIFESSQEWRLMTEGQELGTLPLTTPVHVDGLIVFAGRRWVIRSIDESVNTLIVAPHPGGVVPRFERGHFEPVPDRLAAEMKAVYLSEDVPVYLNTQASELLAEGRATFRRLSLDRKNIIAEDRNLHVMTWYGTQANAVLGAAAAMAALSLDTHDLGLTFDGATESEVRSVFETLATNPAPSPSLIADFVKNVATGKYAEFVPDHLARKVWALQNERIVSAIPTLATRVLAG